MNCGRHAHDVDCLIRALRRDANAAETMLREQPDLLTRTTSRGESALHWLAVENDIASVRFLIRHGARVDTAARAGDTPLLSAARLGLLEMCRLLIEHGADVRHADENGDTALHHAAQIGATDVIELLVRSGADPNSRNHLGERPIERALARKRNVIADALTVPHA